MQSFTFDPADIELYRRDLAKRRRFDEYGMLLVETPDDRAVENGLACIAQIYEDGQLRHLQPTASTWNYLFRTLAYVYRGHGGTED